MSGRPSTLNKEQTLEQAMLLFWQKGYESTSISELESNLNLGRQTIYNTFGDKKHLFLTAYKHYLDSRLTEALELLNSSGPPTDRLKTFYLGSLDCSAADHLGCFIGNTTASPVSELPEVQAITARAIKRFIEALKETLSELYARDAEVEAAAWQQFIFFQGLQLMAKQINNMPQLVQAIHQNLNTLAQRA